MPHLAYANRYWRVAGDEFALPALCSIAGRLCWTALISIIIALSYDSLASCKYGWILIAYLLCSVMLFVSSIVCDGMIMAVSLRGSIVEPEKRTSLNVFLSARVVLGILQLLCAIFGIISLSYKTNVPCSSNFENSQLNRVFVSIVVISQIVDFSVLFCCCYMFSANKVTDTLQPRDQSWALSTWESRCRRATKSVQMCSCNLFGGANITEGFEDVAKMLTQLFHHDGFLDVVPSDVAAGIVLVRLEQRTRRAALSAYYHHQLAAPDVEKGHLQRHLSIGTAQEEAASTEGDEQEQLGAGQLPPSALAQHRLSSEVSDVELLELLARCMLYSLAIYTHLMHLYMRPCSGLCRLSCGRLCAPRAAKEKLAAVIEGDNVCGLHHSGLTAISAALLDAEVAYASFRNDSLNRPFAVFLDHGKRLVVVACRGTLSLEDCMADAVCEPSEMGAAGERWGFDGHNRWAHSGMLKAALHIRSEIEQSGVLARVFAGSSSPRPAGSLKAPLNQCDADRCQSYKLVVTGHSLGAGTAVILAVTLRNAFPDVRCVAFGTPGAVLDRRSSEEFSPFITSVVLGNDLVSRLNVPAIVQLRNEVLDAIARAKVSKMLIMQALFRDFEVGDLMHPKGREPDSQFKANIAKFQGFIKGTMEGLGHHELCLPGRILHLAKIGTERRCCGKVARYSLLPARLEDFAQIEVSSTMAAEHFPDRYYEELRLLADRAAAARGSDS